MLQLIVSCVRYIPIEDDRKWDYVGFLPSTDGQIVANATALSRDSMICKDKSTILATDNIEILILKISNNDTKKTLSLWKSLVA